MRFRSLRAVLLLLSLGVLLAWSGVARAEITCTSVSVADLAFGEVNPLGGGKAAQTTLSYTCSNDNRDPTPNSSAMLCFNVRFWNVYMTGGGSTPLYFNLYRDPSLTLLWGSQFAGSQYGGPLMVPITLPAGAASVPFRATLYGLVPEGQRSVEPGTYWTQYRSAETGLTVASVPGDTAPAQCAFLREERFPFLVTATISPQCVVSAGRALDFGSVQPDARDSPGNTSIDVTCTVGTPYDIGLSPSNGDRDGSGVMSGSRSDNRDKVPYQLRSRPGPRGRPWGNQIGSGNAGNGVSGTGTGKAEIFAVHATAPEASYAPDSYSDTVTVIVYY